MIYSHTVNDWMIYYNKGGGVIIISLNLEGYPHIFNDTEEAEKFIRLMM